ncbi:MAG TPA: phosphatase PAP2 family protein [Candidatus Rubrimentiphilum sp.]|nr:phosphatase PAP2 family protein [Candidatus Rubrimentiphilum sp.]
MSRSTEYYIAAAVLFVAFVALGEFVTRKPALRVDSTALFHAHATPLARFFTFSGRWIFLTSGFVIATLLFAQMHRGVIIPALLLISQMVTQSLAELFKAHYRRVRPEYWVVGLDMGKSYPSGHAVTAIVYFCGWAYVVAFSALAPDLRYALAGVLVAWAVCVDWSRLALGAHYLTDIAGGTLLGSAWLCALLGAAHQFALVHAA